VKHWQTINNLSGTSREDLWESMTMIRGTWPLRTTAIRLSTGGLPVYSPAPNMPDTAWQELENYHRVDFAIAPNHYHNMGLPNFARRFPQAKLVATSLAKKRIEDKTGCTIYRPDELESALGDQRKILRLPATTNGELWIALRDKASWIWIIGDAFFNLTRHPTGLMGLACRATHTSPGLRIGKTWLWMALQRKRRRLYADWVLQQLEETPPSGLVMCHGDLVFDKDLPTRLGDIIRQSL